MKQGYDKLADRLGIKKGKKAPAMKKAMAKAKGKSDYSCDSMGYEQLPFKPIRGSRAK